VLTRGPRIWWLSAAVAGGFGIFLSFTTIGLQLRIALSESALTDYALQVVKNGGEFSHKPRPVGLFFVDGEEQYEGVVFLYTSQSFINREGVAYVPPGVNAPQQIPRHRLRPLYGPWYICYWLF
jgi:hypothetical protein